MTFEELHVESSICKALKTLGYEYPLEVQRKVIPSMLAKRDLIVKSKTGSGKTASFAIPILQSLEINEKKCQALILCPTRELSLQIKEEFDCLGTYKKIKTISITGKQPFRFQKEDLQQRCHVVIGTPGRVLDHLKQGTFDVSNIQTIVLDEADEMLNMNFLEDVKEIYTYLPMQRTSCIFSATYPEKIQELSSLFLKEAKMIEIQNSKQDLEEYFYHCLEENKKEYLIKLLCREKPESCIVFCNRQERVEDVFQYLKEMKISCDYLHGNRMQEERFDCMKRFKEAKIRILIATDVVARGIDVSKVQLVVNYDIPSPAQLYVHRIGRSARVNEKGTAVSFVNEFDENRIVKLEEYLNKKIDFQNIDSYEIKQEDLDCLSKSNRLYVDKTKELRKDIMKLYINGGKNKKLRVGDFVGSICQIEGVTVQDIGVIHVQDHQTYVDIMNGKGEMVLSKLKTVKGKTVKVSKAKQG